MSTPMSDAPPTPASDVHLVEAASLADRAAMVKRVEELEGQWLDADATVVRQKSEIEDLEVQVASLMGRIESLTRDAATTGEPENPDFAPVLSEAFDVACDVVERLKMYPAPEWGRGRNGQITLDWTAINLTVEVYSRETVRYSWTESEDAGTSGGGYWESATANIGGILSRRPTEGDSDEREAICGLLWLAEGHEIVQGHASIPGEAERRQRNAALYRRAREILAHPAPQVAALTEERDEAIKHRDEAVAEVERLHESVRSLERLGLEARDRVASLTASLEAAKADVERLDFLLSLPGRSLCVRAANVDQYISQRSTIDSLRASLPAGDAPR